MESHKKIDKKQTKRLPIVPIVMLVFVVAMVVAVVIRGKGPKGACVYDHVYRRATCKSKNSPLVSIPNEVLESVLSLNIGHKLNKHENKFGILAVDNFTRFTHMQDLSLIKCGIEEIRPYSFSTLSNLNRLDLRYNRLQLLTATMFKGISALTELHLSNNPIQTIDEAVFNAIRIEGLFLENNPVLTTIAKQAFDGARITVIMLNRTNLQQLDDGVFSPLMGTLQNLSITNNIQPMTFGERVFKGLKLKVLDLSNNGITDSEFIEAVEAEEIDLDDNPLEDIDFDDSKTLSVIRVLSLERTKLSRLFLDDMDKFVNLEELDLEGNDITILNATVFKQLDKLEKLDLSNNDLYAFDGDFMSELPNLKVLNLDGNDIQTAPHVLEPLFSRLNNLSIHNNPLHCNCEIRWFIKWIENHREALNELNLVKCETPENINLTLISDYGFQCRAPKIFNATFDEDGISLVCNAGGDPAPKVIWVAPNGHEKIADPLRSERKTYQTQNSYTVSRDGNYTCVAENVAGRDEIVINTRQMPTSGIKFHVESKEIEILETPQGFLITLALICLLGYIIKVDSENDLKASPYSSQTEE